MKLNDFQKITQIPWDPSTPQDSSRFQQLLKDNGITPGEFYQELEMDSPYVNAHRDTSYSNSSVHLHSHSFYELLCCRNSRGVEYLVGTQRYRIQKGDIILVAPGVSHRPILPEQLTDPYRRDVLWFSEEFVQLTLRLVPLDIVKDNNATTLLRTGGTKWEPLGDLFRQAVLEAEAKTDGWQAALMGIAMLIVTQLIRAFRDQSSPPLQAEEPELLDQIMEYTENNLSQKISVKDLARQFYVSESTISHVFREKMGVSYYHYVTQRRLISAKELIAREIPMEDVSRQVGFGDYSSFYRAFKQEYGISPRQLRKLQLGK